MNRKFELLFMFFLQVSVIPAKRIERNVVFVNVTCKNQDDKSLSVDLCQVNQNGNVDLVYTLNQPTHIYV